MVDGSEIPASFLPKGEGDTVEFKLDLNLTSRGKYELAKDCSGFANSKGGLIVYGISDRPGIVTGISTPLPEESIVQIVETRTYPPLVVRVESKLLKNGRYLGLIYVAESKWAVHVIVEDRAVYVRHGVITEKAAPWEIHRLYDERGYPSRTVLQKPTRVTTEDSSVLMLPDRKEAYRVCAKRGHLFQLAHCPLFLPDLGVYGRFPRFGIGNDPLAIGYSHAPPISSRDFIDRARQVERLVRSMPWYFSTLSLVPRFYWSISEDGEFAYGCGVDNLQRAIRNGRRGEVSLAICGEFLGSINKSSLLLVINGYCKYAAGHPRLISYMEITLYLSFVPIESDWVRTLLKPFMFGDRRVIHTLAYEPQRVQLREWRPKNKFTQIPHIKGVIRRVKHLRDLDFTEIDSVIADSNWYQKEDFGMIPASSRQGTLAQRRSTIDSFEGETWSEDPCPIEMLDETPVMLTNPLVALEEVKKGSPDGVDSFDDPEICQLKIPGYGDTIYIISVTGRPSAREGVFSRQAREAERERFFKSFKIPGVTVVKQDRS